MTKRLFVLGVFLLVPYAIALELGDLRLHTVEFEVAFFLAWILYAAAVWLVIRDHQPAKTRQIVMIFAFGIAFRGILVFSQPRLSDDMYRYVWDGRVQATGNNPYLYPPDAPELNHLRDPAIWPLVNRKEAVTVYPAGAELAYAAIWRIWPDKVHWFQAVMALGDLLAGVLLVALLRALGRSPLAVLIYLWCPLVIFETAHSAHIDGLVLLFLLGAWLSFIKGRDLLVGLLLGMATALKLYPVLLLPVLWRVRDPAGKFRPALSTLLAFLAGLFLPYLPYLSAGRAVIGFLPSYIKEHFNPGLAYLIAQFAGKLGSKPEQINLILLLAALTAIYAYFLLRPAADRETILRRCIWPIGAFTLLTQNLFPWYLLWLLPLLAIALPPSPSQSSIRLAGMPLNSWTGWWLFSGLVALSYTFFIHWKSIPLASWAEYLPLYAFLLFDLIRWLRVHPVRSLSNRTILDMSSTSKAR